LNGTDTRTASLTTQFNFPIYEAGDVRAQIRQAKETRQALLENVQVAREQAQADVSSSWVQLVSTRAQLEANKTQVEAAKVSLEGVRAELQVGQRTELDVLNAQQSLNSAQVQQITTKHDIIVNSYRVLSAMGRLSIETLRVPAQAYDVEAHYNDTNGKWWDISVSRENGYAGLDAGTDQDGHN
jgi:outer membrane protein